jgi:hypothetical protein
MAHLAFNSETEYVVLNSKHVAVVWQEKGNGFAQTETLP